jgi:ribosomal protein L37AE/L43A
MHFNSDTICHDRDHLLPCRSWLQSSRLCALNQAFAGISFQKVRLFLFYADRDNRKPVSLRGSERPLPKKTRLVFIEVSKVFPRCTNNYFILLRRKTLSLQGRGYKALVATQPKNVLFLIYKYTNVHRFAIQQNHQNAYVQGKTQRYPCCRLKRKLHEPNCCQCNTINKSSRVHRGLYVCKNCGAEMNAGVNGAVSILKRYLPEQIGVSWSSGCLAQPAVNRFAWRNTRSSASAHESGKWQTSLPHLRTESAVALSSCRA